MYVWRYIHVTARGPLPGSTGSVRQIFENVKKYEKYGPAVRSLPKKDLDGKVFASGV